MKAVVMILMVMGLTTGLFAQKIVRGGGHVVRVRPVIAVGAVAPFYGFGMGYNPFWGNPFYNNYNMHSRPTRLDLQIADIKNDYQQKISSARSDKSISKSERKQIVRDLKHAREQEIIDAKRDYYKISR